MMTSIFATVGDAASACLSSPSQTAKTADETAGEPLFADVIGSFLMNDPPPAKPAPPASAGNTTGSVENPPLAVNIICPAPTTAEATVAGSSETALPVVICDPAPPMDALFFTRPSINPPGMDAAGGKSADTDEPQDAEGPEKGMDLVETPQENLDEERTPRTVAVRQQRGLREVTTRSETADAEILADSCLQAPKKDDCAGEDGADLEVESLICQGVVGTVENLQPQPAVGNVAVVREQMRFSETSAKPSAGASATSVDMAVTPAASPSVQKVEFSRSTPWSSPAGNEQKVMTDVPTHVSPSSTPLQTPPTSGSAADSTDMSRLGDAQESDLPNVMPASTQPGLDAKSDPVQRPSPQSAGVEGQMDYDSIIPGTTTLQHSITPQLSCRMDCDSVIPGTTPTPEINPDRTPALTDYRQAWMASRQPIRIDQSPRSETVESDSSNAATQMPALTDYRQAWMASRQPIRIDQSLQSEPVEFDSSNAGTSPTVSVGAAPLFGASAMTVKTPASQPSLANDRPATLLEYQGLGVSQYSIAGLNKPAGTETGTMLSLDITTPGSQSGPIRQFPGSQQQPAISLEPVELPQTYAAPQVRGELPVSGDLLASVRPDLSATASAPSPVAQGPVAIDVLKPQRSMAGEDALRGTEAASIGDAMKKPNDSHTIAGPDENILPVERDSGFVGQNRREPFGTTIGEKLDSSVFSGLFATHEPEVGRQQLSFVTASESPDTASTAASAQLSVESLADQLMDRVVKFKSLYQDNVAVMVTPDDNTEIHLQFTLGGDGVNVCARVERGDSDLLRANWDQLRQTLADHGVHMGELNRPSADTTNLSQSTAETNTGGAHEQAPRHQPRLNEELAEEIAGAGAMTETPHVRLHDSRRVTPRRWEKWA